MWYLILLGIAYVLINILIWHRVMRLIKTTYNRIINGSKRGREFYIYTVAFSTVYIFLALSVILWTRFSSPSLVHALKSINNVWIGIFIYCLIFIITAEIVTFVLQLSHKFRKGNPYYGQYIFYRGVIVAALLKKLKPV